MSASRGSADDDAYPGEFEGEDGADPDSPRGRYVYRGRPSSGPPGTRRPLTKAEKRRRRKAQGEGDHRAIRLRLNMPLWQELPLLLLLAFGIAVLVRTFAVQAFYIPSASMEETLLIKDRVLVNKAIYNFRSPRRGEVVVFRGPPSWAPETRETQVSNPVAKAARGIGNLIGFGQPGEKDFVKRVIGLPGDTVQCCDNGRVTVNGVPLDEPYIFEDSDEEIPPDPRACESRRFGPVKVDAGKVFVMGDHRGVSQDSRCQGPIPIDHIIGRAFVVVWPITRWGTVPARTTEVRAGGAPIGGGPGDTPDPPQEPLLPVVLIGLRAVVPRGRVGCRGD